MYAPTFLAITIILEFLHGFVGATLRGGPIILAKIRKIFLPGTKKFPIVTIKFHIIALMFPMITKILLLLSKIFPSINIMPGII